MKATQLFSLRSYSPSYPPLDPIDEVVACTTDSDTFRHDLLRHPDTNRFREEAES